jgi:hypothetical protein
MRDSIEGHAADHERTGPGMSIDENSLSTIFIDGAAGMTRAGSAGGTYMPCMIYT